jgi:hypothetical protein
MSRKDDKKRKKRELKKKEARKAEDARRLQRKRDARNAVVSVETILERLKVLFNEDASRAISYALNDSLSDEEIARRLDVPLDRVSELLDLAAQLPDPIVEHFRRFPDVMANPAVLQAIIAGLKQKGFQA